MIDINTFDINNFEDLNSSVFFDYKSSYFEECPDTEIIRSVIDADNTGHMVGNNIYFIPQYIDGDKGIYSKFSDKTVFLVNDKYEGCQFFENKITCYYFDSEKLHILSCVANTVKFVDSIKNTFDFLYYFFNTMFVLAFVVSVYNGIFGYIAYDAMIVDSNGVLQ